MRSSSIKKFLIFSLLLVFGITFCEARALDRPPAAKQTKGAVKSAPRKGKKVGIKGPKSVKKVQREQAAKDRRKKKDYENYVKENQKRSIEIQTPEVQSRMKQNIKNADNNYKAKKKKNASSTRRAGNKYR